VDRTGNEVVPCKYADAQDFSEGLALMDAIDGNQGSLNPSGKMIIPLR
jgi:hypothetical protein